MFHKRQFQAQPMGQTPESQQQADTPQSGRTSAEQARAAAQTSGQAAPTFSPRAMAPSQPFTEDNTAKKEGPNQMNTPNETNNNNAVSSPANRPMDIPGTMPYGRPMAPGVAGYGAPAAAGAAYNPYGSGRKLIIGQGITMSGEIEHCDHLIVEGTVQATLKDAKLLDISEAGVFYGTVDIEEATIAGRFEGDIIVAGRLTVRATGTITGSIRYKELAVEAGATIDGTMTPLNAARRDDNIAAADFSKGKAAAKQGNQKPGEQLPFSADKAQSVSAAE